MKLTDTTIFKDSYTSGDVNLTNAKGVARIFYTETDLVVAKTALGTTPILSPMTYFTNGYFIVNLLINQVNVTIAEKSVITPQMGDKFSAHFFGKSPSVLQVTGVILNPYNDTHRAGMMSAYQHLFRLKQVALMGVAPKLSFVGCTVPGAMLSLQITEQSTMEGSLLVQFDWLVFNIIINSLGNLSSHKVTAAEIKF